MRWPGIKSVFQTAKWKRLRSISFKRVIPSMQRQFSIRTRSMCLLRLRLFSQRIIKRDMVDRIRCISLVINEDQKVIGLHSHLINLNRYLKPKFEKHHTLINYNKIKISRRTNFRIKCVGYKLFKCEREYWYKNIINFYTRNYAKRKRTSNKNLLQRKRTSLVRPKEGFNSNLSRLSFSTLPKNMDKILNRANKITSRIFISKIFETLAK